jgi:hypothetical protein
MALDVLEPLEPLQTAVYARLVADAPLAALVSGVFDHVPDGTPIPYVRLEDWTQVHDHTYGRPGWQITLNVHAFCGRTKGATASRGARAVQRILGRTLGALCHAEATAPLAIVGFALVGVEAEFTHVFPEVDGLAPDRSLWHGVQRFRFWIQQGA